MKMKIIFLILGSVFGFALSRGGATTPEFYAQMFLFEDFHLMILMCIAIGTGAIGFFLLKKFKVKAVFTGNTIVFDKKKMTKHLILGSLLFGMGWGLSGACPGTAISMLGEGKFHALFIISGVLLGTYIFGVFESRNIDKGA